MNIDIVHSMTKDEVQEYYGKTHDIQKCHNTAVSTTKSALEQLKDADVSEFLP